MPCALIWLVAIGHWLQQGAIKCGIMETVMMINKEIAHIANILLVAMLIACRMKRKPWPPSGLLETLNAEASLALLWKQKHRQQSRASACDRTQRDSWQHEIH